MTTRMEQAMSDVTSRSIIKPALVRMWNARVKEAGYPELQIRKVIHVHYGLPMIAYATKELPEKISPKCNRLFLLPSKDGFAIGQRPRAFLGPAFECWPSNIAKFTMDAASIDGTISRLVSSKLIVPAN